MPSASGAHRRVEAEQVLRSRAFLPAHPPGQAAPAVLNGLVPAVGLDVVRAAPHNGLEGRRESGGRHLFSSSLDRPSHALAISIFAAREAAEIWQKPLRHAGFLVVRPFLFLSIFQGRGGAKSCYIRPYGRHPVPDRLAPHRHWRPRHRSGRGDGRSRARDQSDIPPPDSRRLAAVPVCQAGGFQADIATGAVGSLPPSSCPGGHSVGTDHSPDLPHGMVLPRCFSQASACGEHCLIVTPFLPPPRSRMSGKPGCEIVAKLVVAKPRSSRTQLRNFPCHLAAVRSSP